MNDFKIQSGQKIVLIGDSITDCGRRDYSPPIGDGYVSIVANLTTAKHPSRNIEWVNKGINGDFVEGLAERWTRDVLKEKPDWISIAIGINNVARDYEANRNLNESLRDFEESYHWILNESREKTSAKLIMFELFYVKEEDQQQRQFKIAPYNQTIRRLAAEYNAILIPVNSAFEQVVSARPGFPWTSGDGVHPLPVGHALIALTFLEALAWQNSIKK
jgi:lysophospholipase L1-like esterase